VKVAIVGGGVVGLAAAHALLEAGCDVTLLYARHSKSRLGFIRSKPHDAAAVWTSKRLRTTCKASANIVGEVAE